jgi:hypothetical protein
MEILNTPVTSGMPEIIPLVGSMLSPEGKPSAPNVMGGVPAAVFVKLKKAPCRPTALVALVIVAGTSTVSVATVLVTALTGLEMDTV